MTRPAIFKLRLYIAGTTVNSVQAVGNLFALCQTYLPDQHNIELIDVLQEPERALDDQIWMTPTLVKLGPLPPGRIVGTLGQTQLVLHALGLGKVVA